MKKIKKRPMKKHAQYVPGAAGDGFGFFPAVTCQIAGAGKPRVRWVVHHRRRQFLTKEEALASAEAEMALAFEDRELPSSPERMLDHLRQRGFSELVDYHVARSFEEDRRSALGDAFEPAFGDAAARQDPVLHASLLQMVARQMAENDPPETRETFERLLAEGYSPEYIRRMIGFLLVRGLNRSMVRQKPFDVKDYVEHLRRLPEIPPP
jgi:hypothetical protein